MLALLQSFTAVLDEFGVSHGRAKRAALCAGEGLLVVGSFPGDFPKSQSYDLPGWHNSQSPFVPGHRRNHLRYPSLQRHNQHSKMARVSTVPATP